MHLKKLISFSGKYRNYLLHFSMQTPKSSEVNFFSAHFFLVCRGTSYWQGHTEVFRVNGLVPAIIRYFKKLYKHNYREIIPHFRVQQTYTLKYLWMKWYVWRMCFRKAGEGGVRKTRRWVYSVITGVGNGCSWLMNTWELIILFSSSLHVWIIPHFKNKHN